jgi:hypothetical protein
MKSHARIGLAIATGESCLGKRERWTRAGGGADLEVEVMIYVGMKPLGGTERVKRDTQKW